jgi:signal transduction histidine kinase
MLERLFTHITNINQNMVRFAKAILLVGIVGSVFFSVSDKATGGLWNIGQLLPYIAACYFGFVFCLLQWFPASHKYVNQFIHSVLVVLGLINVAYIYISHLSMYESYEFIVFYLISIILTLNKKFLLAFILSFSALIMIVLLMLPETNMPVYDFALTYTTVTIVATLILYARMATEERLQQREKQLQQYARDIQSFAYISSHDMREPLRMITNYMQLLKKKHGDKLDTEAHEYIDFANTGAKNLFELVEGVLTYTTMNDQSVKLRTIYPEYVLDSIKNEFKHLADSGKLILDYYQMPAVEGDERLLRCLFQNMISNAIKYNQSDIAVVLISAVEKDGRVVFCIKDNGIGIPEQYQGTITKPFTRLHHRGEYGGSGLGLAMCKKITELHGGNLWLQSEPGKGTSFYFDMMPAPVKSVTEQYTTATYNNNSHIGGLNWSGGY